MSAQPNDGGPAFPSDLMLTKGVVASKPYGGMSLRDWFAGQALAGMLAGEGATTWEGDASNAYKVADAMIAARGQA